jgi:hypothetical protein
VELGPPFKELVHQEDCAQQHGAGQEEAWTERLRCRRMATMDSTMVKLLVSSTTVLITPRVMFNSPEAL